MVSNITGIKQASSKVKTDVLTALAVFGQGNLRPAFAA